jgi:uncharacterized protein (TIGR02145 family)
VLSAQGNGVTVSNLAVATGSPTTVTFDMSWENTGMSPVWSDTVWVFVDYNNAGKMARLPLSAGATLTETSAPGLSWVGYAENNDQGVWVVGNARSAGSFSATVKLFTATAAANFSGGCAYASNYPPVGEYTSNATVITFTGTSPYDVVLRNGSGTVSQSTNSSDYTIPGGHTVASFTDKTGAPGIFKCIPMSGDIGFTVMPNPVAKGQPVTLEVNVTTSTPPSSAITYSWSVPGFAQNTYTGTPFVTTAPFAPAEYPVTLTARSAGYCDLTKAGTVTVVDCLNPAITAHPEATSVCPGGTVTLSVTASPVTAYLLRNNGSATSEGSNYTGAAYTTAALTAGATYSVVVANGSCSVTSNDAVVSMKTSGCGVQPQGSCTYTEPAEVGTFAAFDKTYSASTYVSLTDERDSKNYPVVKIGSRWIMARKLNYQKDLYFDSASNQANGSRFTSTTNSTPAIGSFWCPGGYSSTMTTSTRESCEVWGALYVWETAVMLDGKWASSAHGSSGWTERTGYGTNTSSANTQNHGQSDAGATTNGRGICPPNWHVPTDGEWGDIMNEMETGTENHNTATGWIGTNAGLRGKSACTAPSGITSGNTYVNDTQVNWYYNANYGTDVYGFRVLPAGYRYGDGSNFNYRGTYAAFWSSSAYNGTNAWCRGFYYSYGTVIRNYSNRSFGLSVRCIRDL